MEEERLQKSFDLFGLTQEASMEEVERAFRKLLTLYSEESLATYSLLEDCDRQEKLELLHDAYNRILQYRQHATIGGIDTKRALEIYNNETQMLCIDANYQQNPGLFLQQVRKAWALSLQDIAARTKVSVYILQSIEEQRLDALPVPVYLRGFIREFAKMVKVPDADALVECYLALYKNHR
jgi:cytoskeleton protein RodZ